MPELTYRGITVTAENYSHALTHLADEGQLDSDLYLQIQAAFDSGGFKRAATYLLQIPAEHRRATVAEAHARTNMVGGRYADRVWDVVQEVKRGQLDKAGEYSRRAVEMARTESANREAVRQAQARQAVACTPGHHVRSDCTPGNCLVEHAEHFGYAS